MIEINSVLNQGVKLGHFPGASYCIVTRDGDIDFDYVGFKQTYPNRIPNNGTEIYDCASLTKVICTTTMIMKLIEDGKLSLESRISTIFPEFKHTMITIQHMLTHSSGLPADIQKAQELMNKEDVLDRIFKFDLINPVGKKIVYSDVGYIILGLIIEKTTNKKLSQYAKEVVFDPLGMKDSSYHPIIERCAPTEYRNDEVYQGLLQGLVHDEKAFALEGEAGHAGLFSTSKDISKFILSILRNDELVLKAETVNSMFPVKVTDSNRKKHLLIRSLGWNKPTIGGSAGDKTSLEDTILHTGFTGCNIWIERNMGIGFVMLSNAVHPKREMNGIVKYRNTIGNLVIDRMKEE